MKIWEFTDDYCITLITISFNYSKKRQKIDSMFKVQIFEEGHKIRNSPIKLPYARHYKPRLVYFFTPFPKTIYVL